MAERDQTIIVKEPLSSLEVLEIIASTTSLVKEGIEPDGGRWCLEWCAKHRLIANSMDCVRCDVPIERGNANASTASSGLVPIWHAALPAQ